MKCPQCVIENEKSCVYPGYSTKTLMATHCYYDEDGKFIYYDPNITTTEYKCSRGHEWTENK